MIDLETRYPSRVGAATAGFPNGQIQNETTPGVTNDGTPLDQAWGNNVHGFMEALLAHVGATANNAIEQVGASQCLDAIITMITNAANPPGTVATFARSTAPDGWIKSNGGTIGNAASGATTRANADTINLFTVLWENFSNDVLPIYTSTGVATTRGASAAADFAANRRLSIFDDRGEFIRGWDDGRGVDPARQLGSQQGDSVKISGTFYTLIPNGQNPDGAFDIITASGASVGGAPATFSHVRVGLDGGGTETAPRNRAYLVCIKL